MQLLLARGRARARRRAVQNRLLELKRRAAAGESLGAALDRPPDRRFPPALHGERSGLLQRRILQLLQPLSSPAGDRRESRSAAWTTPPALGLIRALLADLYSDGGGIFGGIAQTPGFVRIIAALHLRTEAESGRAGSFRAGGADAQRGRTRRTFTPNISWRCIDHDLVDREGEGWLALEQLERDAGDRARGRSADRGRLRPVQRPASRAADRARRAGARRRDHADDRAGARGDHRQALSGRARTAASGASGAQHAARHRLVRRAPTDDRHPALRHLSEQLLRPQAGAHPRRMARCAGSKRPTRRARSARCCGGSSGCCSTAARPTTS